MICIKCHVELAPGDFFHQEKDGRITCHPCKYTCVWCTRALDPQEKYHTPEPDYMITCQPCFVRKYATPAPEMPMVKDGRQYRLPGDSHVATAVGPTTPTNAGKGEDPRFEFGSLEGAQHQHIAFTGGGAVKVDPKSEHIGDQQGRHYDRARGSQAHVVPVHDQQQRLWWRGQKQQPLHVRSRGQPQRVIPSGQFPTPERAPGKRKRGR